jgi:hypothetical protein
MTHYKNLGGDSGVAAYEIGADFIKVQFHDGSVYLYTYRSAGSGSIEQMKDLASAGMGLNSFINTHVKYKYASRLN